MSMICEYNSVEEPVINYLKDLGWKYLTQRELKRLRNNDDKIILFESVIRNCIKTFNDVNEEQLDQIMREVHKIKNGEEFQKWLRNEKSMRLRGNKTSTIINLIDYENIGNNTFQFINQFYVKGNFKNERFDLVLWLNGFPIILFEAKSPEVGLYEGINQIKRYEREIPKFFKYNQFNVALDGNNLKYASTSAPKQFFFEWRAYSKKYKIDEKHKMKKSLFGLLNKETVLDLIQNFIVYAKENNQNVKKICRYQQYEATNLVYNRVLNGKYKSGLIWHTQGSGKTMTMYFTAWKLWRELKLNKPTILLISDRIDLGDQTQGVFESLNLEGIEKITRIDELKTKIDTGAKGIFVCLIQKFNANKLKATKTDRDNIIILIDEGHRTQEGDFGSVLRNVFPNANIFSYTGTPVQKGNKDTFKLYSPIENNKIIEKYLHKYSNEEGVRDGTILPIKYLYKYQEVMLTKSELDAGYFEIIDNMSDEKREEFEKWLLKPENIDVLRKRISKITKDINKHFRDYIEPNGFKAQIVAPNRIGCTIYKEELDKIRPKNESEVIMSTSQNDSPELLKYKKSRQEIKTIINNFKKQDSNPKFLIVTDMLLTGFDAPIEKVMYLDKKLRDHTLLQAIARTNRPAKNKGFGLIVDYTGVLNRLKSALNYEDKDIKNILDSVDTLRLRLGELIKEILLNFKDFDPKSSEYFVDCFNKIKYLKEDLKTKFFEDVNELKTIYETLSPDPYLVNNDRNNNYKFIVKLYLTLRREENPEKYDFEELGEKTKELLEQNVHFGSPRTNNITYTTDQIKNSYINETSSDYALSNKLEEKYSKVMEVNNFVGDLEYDPVIRSLSDRLEQIIKKRANENKLTQEQILKLRQDSKEFKELQKIKQFKEDNNLTNRTLSIFNLLSKNLDYPQDLILVLTKNIDNYLKTVLFMGWTKKASLDRIIALELLTIIKKEFPDLQITKLNKTIENILILLKGKDGYETNNN